MFPFLVLSALLLPCLYFGTVDSETSIKAFYSSSYFTMDTVTKSYEFLQNKTIDNETFLSNISSVDNEREDSIRIIQSTTASVGIIANLTVIVVFLDHKKLRRKIPNIFIINQVRHKNQHICTVGGEHRILTYNGRMFSLPLYHCQIESVNVSTILTFKLKMCLYILRRVSWLSLVIFFLHGFLYKQTNPSGLCALPPP